MRAVGHAIDDRVNLIPPAESPPRPDDHLQLSRANQVARDAQGNPGDDIVEVVGGTDKVDDRLGIERVRRNTALRPPPRVVEGRVVDRHPLRWLNAPARRDSDLDDRVPAVSEPEDLGCGLMAEQRARPGVEHGGPQSCFPADLSGEGVVDARVDLLPQAVPDLGGDRARRNARHKSLPAADRPRLFGNSPAQARWNIAPHAAEYAVRCRHSQGRSPCKPRLSRRLLFGCKKNTRQTNFSFSGQKIYIITGAGDTRIDTGIYR